PDDAVRRRSRPVKLPAKCEEIEPSSRTYRSLERETVHTLGLRRAKDAGPRADEHHVVHDCRAGRDATSEGELLEQRARCGIEGTKLSRAVADEDCTRRDPRGPEAEHVALGAGTLPNDAAVRGTERGDEGRTGEGPGVDASEGDSRRSVESAQEASRHQRLLPHEGPRVLINGVVGPVLVSGAD